MQIDFRKIFFTFTSVQVIEIANQPENNIRLIVKYFMLLFAAITFYTSYSGRPLYTFFIHLKKKKKKKEALLNSPKALTIRRGTPIIMFLELMCCLNFWVGFRFELAA